MQTKATQHPLCIKCTTKIPTIVIERKPTKISLSCECGYNDSLSIKEYLDIYNKSTVEADYSFCTKHNKSYHYYSPIYDCHYCKECIKHNTDSFLVNLTNNYAYFKKRISDANSFINVYLTELKNEIISKLEREIKKANDAYESCIARNQEMLSFLSILINNYQVNYNIHNFFARHLINNVKCKMQKTEAKIDYINTFNILYHSSGSPSIIPSVFSSNIVIRNSNKTDLLFLFKKDHLAVSSVNIINFYDIKHNYTCVDTITETSKIETFFELDNGNIVILTSTGNISIWSNHKCVCTYQSKYKYDISFLIPLANNLIAFYSNFYEVITIRNATSPFDTNPIKTISIKSLSSFHYIKERDLLLTVSNCSVLRLWNMKTYQCVSVLSDIELNYKAVLEKIDKDRVCIGKNSMFYIINIEKCIVEEIIIIEQYIVSLVKWKNNKIIFGGERGGFAIYNYITKKIVYLNAANTHFENMIKISENEILAQNDDLDIKILK